MALCYIASAFRHVRSRLRPESLTVYSLRVSVLGRSPGALLPSHVVVFLVRYPTVLNLTICPSLHCYTISIHCQHTRPQRHVTRLCLLVQHGLCPWQTFPRIQSTHLDFGQPDGSSLLFYPLFAIYLYNPSHPVVLLRVFVRILVSVPPARRESHEFIQ